MQRYILATVELPNRLLNFCLSFLKDMITDSYGNYILQRMIKRNRQLLAVAVSYCLSNLEKLVDDEYASRFMQSAVREDVDFRKVVFDRFGRQPDLFT